MSKYSLKCIECDSIVMTKGKFDFECGRHDSLLRSEYSVKRIKFRDYPGIWKFYDWLPVDAVSDNKGKPVSYRSVNLANELGLEDLYVSFNGYWPEKDANLGTCTFKELEAIVTVQFAKEGGVKRLVVASAGNTANAFAQVASVEEFPVVLVVPRKCLCDLMLPEMEAAYVKTIVVEGDYSDAISLAKRLAEMKGFTYEGGARNIARRDGLGTVFLDAVSTMKVMPRHYFQAIGSGTGAIAAWEAAIRLLEDGRFGGTIPRLHMAQNLPVAPMLSAWRDGRRELIPERDLPQSENVLDLIYARVLSNRYPPYGVSGGVFDALLDSRGDIYGITNQEARRAGRIFEEAEGIDILPAAAVCVASLIKAVEDRRVGLDESILLNVTGGGSNRRKEDMELREIEVDFELRRDASDEELGELEL
ncbi:MAG: cysteate synthase [Candidatus Hydrothermarchaeaceae archaeon]